MVDETPLRRKWLPANEQELREKFDEGMFEETNWCELKREIGSSKTNAELARDLCSLAVDGGTLIVGLDEKAPEGNPLHPVELRGLCERIESVAATRPQPPLQVETSRILAADRPGFGYAIVHVPASPLAPHQVEGVYYGRGDKQKRRLSDADVERLFVRWASWSRNSLEDLDRLMSAKGASDEQRVPQLYLTARPVAAWPDIFRPVVAASDWNIRLQRIHWAICNDPTMKTAATEMFKSAGGWRSTMSDTRKSDKTALGARLASPSSYVTRKGHEWSVELEIAESGAVNFFMGAVGDPDLNYNGVDYTGLYIDTVATTVLEVLTAIKVLSEQVGYASAWDVGLAVTNLQGSRVTKASIPGYTMGFHLTAPFGAAEVRRATRANGLDLARNPGSVLERLLGLYARATDTEHYLAPLMAARSALTQDEQQNRSDEGSH